MKRSMLAAALLATLTAAVHLFVGTAEIAAPLPCADLPTEVRYVLYACWHLVSVALVLSALLLALATHPRHGEQMRPATRFAAALWLAFGLVFVAIGVAVDGGALLGVLPQWTLLLPVGALALWASRVPAVGVRT